MREHTFYDLNLLTWDLVMVQKMVNHYKFSLCPWKKNLCSDVSWSLLWIPIRLGWLVVLFKSSTSDLLSTYSINYWKKNMGLSIFFDVLTFFALWTLKLYYQVHSNLELLFLLGELTLLSLSNNASFVLLIFFALKSGTNIVTSTFFRTVLA